MGQAESALPELARLSPQFTLLPFIMAFWWHNRSYTGWAFAAATVSWWQYAIRMGAGVSNPLQYYAGADLTQATYIYLTVYGTLIWACALCGTAIAYLLDMPYPIPLEMLLPESPGHVITSPLGAESGDARITQQDAMLAQQGGVNAFGYTNLRRPYGPIVVTMIAFVLAVALPFIMFEYIFPYSDWGAYLGALLVIIAVYICFGIYLHFKAAHAIYGVTLANLKERELLQGMQRKEDDARATDPDIADKERAFARTRWVVWKFILVTGGLQLFGTVLWFGIAAFAAPPDVDAMWISQIAVIGGVMIIIAIIVIIYARVMRSRYEAQLLLQQRANATPSSFPEETPEAADETPADATQTPTNRKFATQRAAALSSFLLPKGGRS